MDIGGGPDRHFRLGVVDELPMNTIITALIWLALFGCALVTFIGPVIWHKR